MRSFTDRDIQGQEAVNLALSLCCTSTLAPRSPAFEHILAMLDGIRRGENAAALRSYHDATAAMLDSGALRVSGDLWKDELLCCLIQHEHPFALAAAAGRRDVALIAAMKEELCTLRALFTLSSEAVLSMFRERPAPRPQRDDISVMSAAVWSGGTSRPIQRQPQEEPHRITSVPLTLVPWEYGRGVLEGDWAAEEALEELYMRFFESEDWPALTENLFSFFAAYGSGPFLRDRAFRVSGPGLAPIRNGAESPLPQTSLYEEQRAALLENTIAFMRGESRRNMLLYGEGGLGKTWQVISLLHELPEVRLILASAEDLELLCPLLDRLAAQPLRFILLLDDVEADCREMRIFAARTLGLRAVPENVVIYATARESQGALFPAALRFDYPTLPQFSRAIVELVETRGGRVSRNEAHNAAVDHQVDVREKLTLGGALAIAERLMGEA